MPEGEPSQFDPNEPDEPVDGLIDKSTTEPSEPATEAEPSLEQLKNPKYWEQEFQKSWESKAGQEKNWAGLRMLKEYDFTPTQIQGEPIDGRVLGVNTRGQILRVLKNFILYEFHEEKTFGDLGTHPVKYSVYRTVNTDQDVLFEKQFHSSQISKAQRYEQSLNEQTTNSITLPDKKISITVSHDPRQQGLRQFYKKGDGTEHSQLIKGDFYGAIGLIPSVSVACSPDGKIVVAPTHKNGYQIWSSPFYAGYWSEIDRDQELETKSIGNTLTKAIDDITNMPLERIQGIQIDLAMRAFSKRFPNQKKNREIWQNCTDVAKAFQQGFDSWREKTKTLPRPAETPGPSTETLPRPANRDNLDQ